MPGQMTLIIKAQVLHVYKKWKPITSDMTYNFPYEGGYTKRGIVLAL
jgi:hypothetical protein